MLGMIFNAIAVLIAMAVLLAFVLGAWRHTVEQTLGDPLLVDPSPNPHLTHAINTHLKTICYDIENLRVALHLKK